MGASRIRKSLKLKLAAEPIMILGGSPTRVATPPVLESKASEIRKGMGDIPRISAIKIETGAISTKVVTLSRNMDNTVVIPPRMSSNFHGSPWERLAVRMARYWKKPVSDSMLTKIIMPSNKPRVLKSMDNKADSCE